MIKVSIKNIVSVLSALFLFNLLSCAVESHIFWNHVEAAEDNNAEEFIRDIQKLLIEDNLKLWKSSDEEFYDETHNDIDIEIKEKFQTGRIIVKSEKYIEDVNAQKCISGYNNLYIFQYGSAYEAKQAYDKFNASDDIIYVEVDEIISLDNDFSACDEERYYPLESSDSKIIENKNSWGISLMKMKEYDEFLLEMDKINKYDIVVSVIDTGVNRSANSVFNNRIISGVSFTYINENMPFEDIFKREPDFGESAYIDDNGHGTSVAGIIAQSTLDNVKILPIKALNYDGKGSELAVYASVIYGLDKDVDVINLSCGADGESFLYEEVMAEAEEKGVIVVAAAGNERQDVANVFPAGISSVITVTSINKDLKFSNYSNFGKMVDFCAPGEQVELIDFRGGYRLDSGTSFSAPLISAAAAKLLCANPDFTNSEIFNILRLNAIDLGDEGWDEKYGYGWIDTETLEDDIVTYVTEANGDANNDGTVDVEDALFVLKTVTGDAEMDFIQKARVGVYWNYEVNVSQALEILKVIVGKKSCFGK